MKTADEVNFGMTEVLDGDYFQKIYYAFEPFVGASEFHYILEYVEIGEKIDRVIYGINYYQGCLLLKVWNNTNPAKWRYTPKENLSIITPEPKTYSSEEILKIIKNIEEQNPLSELDVENGRYAWPDRWNALKKLFDKKK